MAEEKTHWKSQLNYEYLGAYSLPDGKDIVVKILSVSKETIKGAQGETQECLVAKIENNKPMIINKTNAKTIQKLAGSPFLEDWRGLLIQLYSSKVKAFGDVTDALRIRDVKPQPVKVDVTEPIKKLNECKTLAELQSTFLALPKNIQGVSDVIALKDKLKTTLK